MHFPHKRPVRGSHDACVFVCLCFFLVKVPVLFWFFFLPCVSGLMPRFTLQGGC